MQPGRRRTALEEPRATESFPDVANSGAADWGLADENLLHAVRARCVLRGAVTLWVFPTVRSPLERITEEDEYGYRDARFAVPTPGR